MNIEKVISEREKIYARIIDILRENQFELSIKYLSYINEYLFSGIYFGAGHIRKNNIIKEETILGGDTVNYANYNMIYFKLDSFFKLEKDKDYINYNDDKKCRNLAKFMADIWCVHPFYEGNTRTSSVFIESYLRYMGYNTDNTIFRENAKYVRNALVRANYNNYELSIKKTYLPLELFFKKVIIDNDLILDDNILYTDIQSNLVNSKKKILKK